MRVAVIGTGYVGLVTGAGLAQLGHSVICADISAEKIATLSSGGMPIWELGLFELLHKVRNLDRIRFTTDVGLAIRESDVLIISVGTPYGANGEADLSQFWSVINQAALHSTAEKFVVIKSTVPVGTSDKAEHYMRSLTPANENIDVIHNPEFLRQGNAIHDFFNPDRIVAGCHSEKARSMIGELYQGLSAPVLFCDRRSSEMIKYASNAFLAMKISYINMIADFCEEAEAHVDVVAEGMGMDRRIGASFLQAGIGYGGSCFPKDIRAFQDLGNRLGCSLPLLDSTEAINQNRPQILLNKLKQVLGSMRGTRIALLGLSFKPMTDDIREAPSLIISRMCLEHGATVHGYDPLLKKYPQPGVVMHRDLYEAIDSCDAMIILTEWEQFRSLDWSIVSRKLRGRLIIDGRNMFSWDDMQLISKEYDLTYLSIGRPPIYAKTALPSTSAL
jgi:UDPglucose 6-dehydrogenase